MAMAAEEYPIFLYQDTRISYTSAFYATRESQRIIQRSQHKEKEGLYLIREGLLNGEAYDVYYQLTYRKETVYLVRFR